MLGGGIQEIEFLNSIVGLGTGNQRFNVQVKPPLSDIVGLSQLTSNGTRMVFTDGLVVKEDKSQQTGGNGYAHIKLQDQASPNHIHVIGTFYSSVQDASNNLILNVAKANGSNTQVAVFRGDASTIFRGNILHAGSITSISDESVKTGISDIDMSKVFDAVSVKTYTRTDRPEMGVRVGFISQHIQKACTDSGLPDSFTSTDDNDLVTLDYSKLTTVLWSKVKELETRLRNIELAIENA